MYDVAMQIFNGINSAFDQLVLILKKFIEECLCYLRTVKVRFIVK